MPIVMMLLGIVALIVIYVRDEMKQSARIAENNRVSEIAREFDKRFKSHQEMKDEAAKYGLSKIAYREKCIRERSKEKGFDPIYVSDYISPKVLPPDKIDRPQCSHDLLSSFVQASKKYDEALKARRKLDETKEEIFEDYCI